MLRTAFPLTVAALLAAAVAPGQFPFGGPPGGSGGGPMGDLMERVVFGTIEDVNPVLGYLQVGVPMRGSRVVIVGEQTVVTHMAEAPRSELKPGDEVTIVGMPTMVLAEKVQVGSELSIMDIMRALQAEPAAAAPAPPGGEGAPPAGETPPAAPAPPVPSGPPPGGFPGGGPPASVTLTGKVRTVEPLVVTLASGSDVAVELPEGAQVLRRADADASAALPGESIVAIGEVDADGYLIASRVYLGESLSMGRSGFGRGRGGGGGFGFPGMGPGGGPAGGEGGGQ